MSRKIQISEEHGNFFWVTHSTYDYLITRQASSQTKAVYLALKRHANKRSECWPSQRTLMRQAKVSKPIYLKALRELREWGVLEIESGKVKGEPNKFTLFEVKEEGGQKENQGWSKREPGGGQLQNQGGGQKENHELDTLQQEGASEQNSGSDEPGKRSFRHPFHNDFMGAWRMGHTEFYNCAPDAKYMKMVGKQFKTIIYPEFSWVDPQLILLCIRRFWLPSSRQSEREARAVRNGRTVGALGYLIRMECEAAAEQEAEEQGRIKVQEVRRKERMEESGKIKAERERLALLRVTNPTTWAREQLPKHTDETVESLQEIIDGLYFTDQKEAAEILLKELGIKPWRHHAG